MKIVTNESEVGANVTNQEGIQNSLINTGFRPTYTDWVEWITGQFNPTPIQRNWWGGEDGNSGRLAGAIDYKELKPREYSTSLTILLGTVSEFNSFLAIVGCHNWKLR